MKKAAAKAQFVENVITKGGLPLPILNKIKNKFLYLVNYPIEPTNFSKLAESIEQFVPSSLNKIALINNRLDDHSDGELFTSLSKVINGPKTIAIVQNSLGPATMGPIDEFLQSEAARGLKRLILKDPLDTHTR